MQPIFAFLSAILFLAFAAPAGAGSAHALSPSIVESSTAPLLPVGTGRYNKLGLGIYQASLWAPGGVYDRSKPSALQLEYMRSLSKDTVVDAVMADLKAQNNASEETLNEWRTFLAEVLPAIKKGDEIVGLSIPGQASKVFFNGRQVATISDMHLSDSFFNIWLGDVANQKLRTQLISQR